jgi:hypothetical protein
MFDCINHEALLQNFNTKAKVKQQIKAISAYTSLDNLLGMGPI